MKMRTVEVYYGYFAGDAKMWDTTNVAIPGDTPDHKIEEVARKVFLARPPDSRCISFCGLYNDETPVVDEADDE